MRGPPRPRGAVVGLACARPTLRLRERSRTSRTRRTPSQRPAPRRPDEAAQRRQVDGVHVLLVALLLGGLQDHRVVAEARVVDEQAERLQAELAAADVGVAIDAAPERAQAVVDAQTAPPAPP